MAGEVHRRGSARPALEDPHLVEWAGHRPFIWVDDEIGAVDRLWVAAQHRAPSLLHRVDPGEGLTDDDVAVLADWLRTTVPNRATGAGARRSPSPLTPDPDAGRPGP